MKKYFTLCMMAVLFTLRAMATVEIPDNYYTEVTSSTLGEFALYDVTEKTFVGLGNWGAAGTSDTPYYWTVAYDAEKTAYTLYQANAESGCLKIGYNGYSWLFTDGNETSGTVTYWTFTAAGTNTYKVMSKKGNHSTNENEQNGNLNQDFYLTGANASTTEGDGHVFALITADNYQAFKPSMVTSISESAKTTLNWNNATVSNCQAENGGNNIGYTGGSSVATLSIANGVEGQAYLLEFNTGADGCSAVITVTLKNDAGIVALQDDFTIENIGTWDLNTYHSLFIPSLATGEYELEFKVKSNEGSFAGNWGKPTFTKVNTIPGTLDLYAGVYAPLGWDEIKVENEGANVGYIKNGRTATYLIYNAQAQSLDLTIDIDPLTGGGAMTVTLENVESGVVDYTENLTIAANSENGYTTETFAMGNISNGMKRLTLTFSSDADDWICNYKNVTFSTPIDVTVTEAGYATLYYADAALEIPEGVKAYTVHKKSTTEVELVAVSDIIPAGEPVLLEAAAGTYKFAKTTVATVSKDAANCLRGAGADGSMTAEDGVNFYKLAKDETNGLGFYWGVENGATFNLGTTGKDYQKAYLVMPNTSTNPAPQRLSWINADETTTIKTVESKPQHTSAFTLSGMPADKNTKGIVIMNGKKYFRK